MIVLECVGKHSAIQIQNSGLGWGQKILDVGGTSNMGGLILGCIIHTLHIR